MSKANRHEKAPVAPTTRAFEINEAICQENNVMTKNTTVVDMRKFVEARDGKVFTTSQQVAQAFGKQHHHVVQRLETLECSAHFLTSNFSRVQFEHRGNTYDAFEMTKDGFMFLVMGFTGKPAAAVKEAYIAAFNELAERLGVNSETLVGDLVGAVIGSSGEIVLDRVIDQRAYLVPRALQRSFRHTIKSRLRTRFNVQRTALIPADCLADACNFIAAYVLEGEYIPKPEANSSRLDIHAPVSELVKRRPDMVVERRDSDHIWLDVMCQDVLIRPADLTLCEKILCELRENGYEVEGAWLEMRTFRNCLFDLNSRLTGLTQALKHPIRYSAEGKAA